MFKARDKLKISFVNIPQKEIFYYCVDVKQLERQQLNFIR